MTRLQKTIAKWDGCINTEVDVKNMKIEACLLIGKGITDSYYEKTFGKNGKIQTIEDAQKYASDAAQGVGSFNPYAVHQAWRRYYRRSED